MKKIAVGFDFDRTLGVDNHLERRAFGVLAGELGAAIDIKAPAISQTIDDLLGPFRLDEESMDSMVARFVATLSLNGSLHGRSADSLAAQYRDICYSLVDEMVQPLPGAIECIAELVSAGTPIGILTNGWSQLQERKVVRALGDFPGPVLVSADIDAYKPSARAFQLLEAALGVTPAQLWFVGDNPTTDIAGALAYGCRAVWLNDGSTPYPDDLPAPTVEIKSLDALPALIRGT